MTTFAEALKRRDFVLGMQLALTPDSDADSIRATLAEVRGQVDGVLVPDNQFGHVHMSPLAAGAIALNAGIDPILELACRHRNRIALISDLLGARALGISSVLAIRGRKAPGEIASQNRYVQDIGTRKLIAIARNISDDEKLTRFAGFTVGTVATVHDPQADWSPVRLTEKIDSGAQFIQTHLCFDMQLLERYLQQLVASGITRSVRILVATGVFGSADAARRLRDDQPHIVVPDSLVNGLESARDPLAYSIEQCAQFIRASAAIPGVSGVNLAGDPTAVAAAIDASGCAQASSPGRDPSQ